MSGANRSIFLANRQIEPLNCGGDLGFPVLAAATVTDQALGYEESEKSVSGHSSRQDADGPNGQAAGKKEDARQAGNEDRGKPDSLGKVLALEQIAAATRWTPDQAAIGVKRSIPEEGLIARRWVGIVNWRRNGDGCRAYGGVDFVSAQESAIRVAQIDEHLRSPFE